MVILFCNKPPKFSGIKQQLTHEFYVHGLSGRTQWWGLVSVTWCLGCQLRKLWARLTKSLGVETAGTEQSLLK